MVSVVALDATDMLAKKERRPGNEDDSGDGENREDTVPEGTFLLQEDPSQEGGKDWITERSMKKRVYGKERQRDQSRG